MALLGVWVPLPSGGRERHRTCTAAGTLGAVEHYPDVDAYLEGSEQWPDEIAALRPILLDCQLTESIKWGKPVTATKGRTSSSSRR